MDARMNVQKLRVIRFHVSTREILLKQEWKTNFLNDFQRNEWMRKGKNRFHRVKIYIEM